LAWFELFIGAITFTSVSIFFARRHFAAELQKAETA
jgi:hypothetical protein